MRADGGAARRARPAERSPVDDQRQLSGAWRSERLREHARGDPTQRQVGGEGRLARGRRAPCVEPKRRATTGVAASRRCTSLLDRSGRELGGGSRLGSAEAAAATGGGGRQVTEGFSRAGFSREETDSDWDSQATVLDEDPDEGDADDKKLNILMNLFMNHE